jgi:hypothetical protein
MVDEGRVFWLTGRKKLEFVEVVPRAFKEMGTKRNRRLQSEC